jgi:hypothetical protein
MRLLQKSRGPRLSDQNPKEPVLSSSFIQPVERFWKLLEDLYPERSTACIQEFREF